MWICTQNYHDALGLYISVNGGSWQCFDPGIVGWYDGVVGCWGNSLYRKGA